MNIKYWGVLIVVFLFALNSFTGGAVNDRLIEAMNTVDAAEIGNKTICAAGLFIISPQWWIPSGDDLALAIGITAFICWLFRKKRSFTNLQKVIIFAVSWFLYKLAGLWLVFSNPQCAELYETGAGFLEGPLGIIITVILTLYAAKWIISRYR